MYGSETTSDDRNARGLKPPSLTRPANFQDVTTFKFQIYLQSSHKVKEDVNLDNINKKYFYLNCFYSLCQRTIKCDNFISNIVVNHFASISCFKLNDFKCYITTKKHYVIFNDHQDYLCVQINTKTETPLYFGLF